MGSKSKFKVIKEEQLMRKLVVFAIVAAFLAFPLTAFGTMGQMSPKSNDINVSWFGSLKTYPMWTSNLDFGGGGGLDWMLDENGILADHNVRNELRMGWKGGNDTFDFMIILEGDFNLDKNNTDRGANKSGATYEILEDQGMTGDDFGIEKLDIGYNFGCFRIHTGWTTRWLDIKTGGLVYGDDHPYIGLTGNIGENFSWEADYTIVYDATTRSDDITPFNGRKLDWRFYSVKGMYKIPDGFAKGFVISPFYAYSDNNDTQTNNAQVSYFGLEGYGKLGMFTPRFEIAYADGDTDKDATGTDYDISAMAFFASVDIEVSPKFIPYLGIKWEEGDSDPTDDDIEAFNAITDISRYTPTFGMENAIVYRYVTSLGTHLYSGNFNRIGSQAGYGGISNSSRGDAPGLLMWGLGFKGKYNKWSYKVQYMDFQYDEEPLGLDGTSTDDEVGQELDIRIAYTFSNHFTIANTFAAFDPGDGIQDRLGNDYDDTALVDTIELIWNW
jgi:hypothetical protein